MIQKDSTSQQTQGYPVSKTVAKNNNAIPTPVPRAFPSSLSRVLLYKPDSLVARSVS